MTKQELIEHLRDEDQITLLELLDISSDDIVDAFLDRVEDKFDYLEQQYLPPKD